MRTRFARSRARALVIASILAGLFAVASADASVIYTYDRVGRLVSALYDNNTCIVYAYDTNGNRTSQTITAGGSPSTPTWGVGVYGCFRWTP
jgi:YD repeat-containing protein